MSYSTETMPALRAGVQYGKLVPGVEAYLYDTVHRENTNLAFEMVEVALHDARASTEPLSLATNGFELGRHRSACAHRAMNADAVGDGLPALRDDYFAEMIPYVAGISGAQDVFPQPNGLLIRHGKRSSIRTQARPANFAHCDFTLATAQEMAELILAERGRRLSDYAGFAIYQTWRAVSPPPQDSLLTFCDARTVHDEDCLIVRNVNGPEDEPGNVFYLKLGLARAHHRWFYFPDLVADEMILFMGHDSRRPHQPNVLHTSFSNPLAGADSVPRVSIEARLFAFF